MITYQKQSPTAKIATSMPTRLENIITAIFMSIGVTTGSAGLLLTEIDLILAIILKSISIFATILVICVNWNKAKAQIKEWFKK